MEVGDTVDVFETEGVTVLAFDGDDILLDKYSTSEWGKRLSETTCLSASHLRISLNCMKQLQISSGS